MTAVSAQYADPTSFERVLLHTASTLDRFVTARLDRRSTARPGAGSAAAQHDDSRGIAQAFGSIGMLPR